MAAPSVPFSVLLFAPEQWDACSMARKISFAETLFPGDAHETPSENAQQKEGSPKAKALPTQEGSKQNKKTSKNE